MNVADGANLRVASSTHSVPLAFTVKSICGSLAAQSCEGCAAAWITSSSRAGLVNLAPFSFFNAVSSDPIYVVVGIGLRDDGTPKDTVRNIESTGEFVVNLVTEDLLRAMNISAVDFPPDDSELIAADLQAAPSVRVKVPRLADAEVSLECKLFQSHALGTNTLCIGEVVMFHVAEQAIGHKLPLDESGREALRAIAAG